MLKVDMWHTVKVLHRKQQSIKKISRQLGISRNSVRKIIHSKSYKEYVGEKDPKNSVSLAAPFHDEILRMAAQDLIGSRILNELRSQGYKGSKTCFYDYLKKLNVSLKTSKICIRYETSPAAMAQYDWSPYTVQIGGELVKVYVFSLLLCWSRFRHYSWSLDEKQGSVFDGIEQGFEHVGGVTKSLLVDNHRTMVTSRQKGSVEWNAKFHEFAGYYGLEPIACSVANPRAKGKVENPFRYLEQHFLKGNSFRDFADFSSRLGDFNHQVNARVHTTTRLAPQQMHAEEQKQLGPLPGGRFVGLHETFRKVNWDCLVSFEGNKYSVPYVFAGKSVWVRTSQGRRLFIFSQSGKKIAQHDICREKGCIIIDPKHYEGLRKRGLHSKDVVVLKFRELFPQCGEYIKGLEASKRFKVAHHLSKIIELARHYDPADIEAAVQTAMSYRTYSSKVVLGLLRASSKLHRHPVQRLQVEIGVPHVDVTRDLSDYGKIGGTASCT